MVEVKTYSYPISKKVLPHGELCIVVIIQGEKFSWEPCQGGRLDGLLDKVKHMEKK